MTELRRITRDDAAAILAFELENRAYFARSVSDRGDEFYERFADHHDALLADQAAGASIFHVLIEDDGAVIGRVNLYDLDHGRAEVGYRIAEQAVGRGVATAAVDGVATLAKDKYHLKVLAAKVVDKNLASKRVLEKVGFVRSGSTEIHGEPASRYELVLHDLRSSD